jgi:protein-S-isoprenylcysteine O-methyltransferase Ste14
MNQQVEHLGLHGNELAAAAQLAKGGIETMIVEVKFHARYRILFSRNNQVRLTERSSAGQSLVVAFPASCTNQSCNPIAPRGVNFMTETRAISPAKPGNRALKFTAFLFGAVSYLTFLVTILYAIGFVEGLVVPKTIDTGADSPAFEALAINLALMSLFAVQHSVMARKSFKQWWTQYVPRSIERSIYVLFASLTLLLLFWQWRPLPAVVWHVEEPQIAMALTGLSMLGWVIVFTSTFLINHFELFGLHQVANDLVGRKMPTPVFRTPLLYKFVRHPIYLGFIIAFWAAPTMSAGHLLFAAVTTAYIFVGILLEERDLVDMFGDEYRRYRQRVSMLVPWRKSI